MAILHAMKNEVPSTNVEPSFDTADAVGDLNAAFVSGSQIDHTAGSVVNAVCPFLVRLQNLKEDEDDAD